LCVLTGRCGLRNLTRGRMLRSAQPIIRFSRLVAGEVAPGARVRASFYRRGGRRAQPPVGEGSADQPMRTVRRTPLLSGPPSHYRKRLGLRACPERSRRVPSSVALLIVIQSRRGEESRLLLSPLPVKKRIKGKVRSLDSARFVSRAIQDSRLDPELRWWKAAAERCMSRRRPPVTQI
jgi:hypothetical protein